MGIPTQYGNNSITFESNYGITCDTSSNLYIDASQNLFFNAGEAFIFSGSSGTATNGGCIYALGGTSTTATVPVYTYTDGYRGTAYTWGGTYPSISASGSFTPEWPNAATANNSYAGGASYSLVVNHRILCSDEIDVFSDKRIKQNITPLVSNDSLHLIRQIVPVSYNHKDIISRGLNNCLGFIAQDVKDILPSSINLIKEYIPNIYEEVEILNKNTIKLNSKTKEDFYINATNDEVVNLKFFIMDTESNNEIMKICTLNKFIDDKTFEINEEIDLEHVFLFGQEVDDFHVVNYDDVYLINISAVKQLDQELQEVKKVVEKQQAQIEFLLNEINILKNK